MFFLGSCSNHFDRRDNGYPTFTGGWPLAINTTKIDGVCPAPKPGSPSSHENYVANTYAIADGIVEDCSGTALAAQKLKLAKCRKYGFKNVQARKVWHGRPGFGQDSRTTGTRYLKATIERSGYVTGDDSDEVRYQKGTSSYNQKRVVSVGRYSGQGARLVDIDEFDDPGSQGNLDYIPIAPDILLTYEDGEPVYTWSTGDPALDSYLNETDPIPSGLSVAKSWSATSLEISVTETISPYSPSDSPFQSLQKKIKITLEEPYTVDDVNEDLDGLLGYWNLDDDVVYPFRTDTFTHHAPLVCYDEAYNFPRFDTEFVPGMPDGRLLGRPLHLEVTGLNRGGNQRFWNSNHANTQVNSITGNVDIVSRGAYAPDWCPNATHWTEDTSNVRFVQGAFFSFQNSMWPMDAAWKDWIINQNTAIKTKWCETFMWTYPAHNYARPCGPDDRAKMDDGEPRWPDAPCFCNDPTQKTGCETPENPDAVNPLNSTTPKGDFCVKRFGYDFKVNAVPTPPVLGPLTSVSCEQHTATRTPCQPTVIYIQKDAPARPGAIHIAEPSRPHFDEINGGLSIVQIVQRMVDPLWREGDSENPPMEECRDCEAMGGCEGYVESVNAGGQRDNRCEWGEDKAWILPEIEPPF